MYTIELDCPPGNPRPDQLFPGVLEGTGLKVTDFENVGRFFGNWTWALKERKGLDKKYLKARSQIQKHVEELYHAGWIRYGSW